MAMTSSKDRSRNDRTVSSFTHLECTRCQRIESSHKLCNLCECGAPLFARYDLNALREVWPRAALESSRSDLWRYAPLLPVFHEDNRVTLGEGWTPVLSVKRLASRFRLDELWIKDESPNPTASFKARGLSLAVSRAKELGVENVALPSAGNAGSATAAYTACAGIEAHVFMPRDVPMAFRYECEFYGAKLQLIEGLITDCARKVNEGKTRENWFDLSTLKEPYRVEGKKTMGYELAEQFEWNLPDVIVYPTGGGTGLIGMWKAFQEMEELGWIGSSRPRMVAVQSTGCAPIVRAFEQKLEYAPEWQHAATVAAGLRVPKAIGDFLMLRALRESHGTAVAVAEERIVDAVREYTAATGIFLCPEGAAALEAVKQLVAEQWIKSNERVVVFNTGSGLKYADSLG